MEANAQGLRCTKQAISLLADQELKSSALELEKAIIKGETCAIVDKCFELGSNMTYVELSTEPGYMDEFVAACFLPHTNRELFPSSVQE